jgi:uncharacterized DUF497 family protein
MPVATEATIYVLADALTGEVRYCGKTVRALEARRKSHLSSARRCPDRHISRWINSIGGLISARVIETVYFRSSDIVEQRNCLNDAERRWIAKLRAAGVRLTNATDGGDGKHGVKLADAVKEKIRRAHIGKKASAEARANMRAAGLKVDPARRARGEKLSAMRITYWASANDDFRKRHGERHRGVNNSNSRLDDKQVIEIFLSPIGCRRLARSYDVSEETIYRIQKRKSHSWLTASLPEQTRRRSSKSL